VFSREMYFATYQSIARTKTARPLQGICPRFFDLVIVTSAIAAARGKNPTGARFSNTLNRLSARHDGHSETRRDNRDTYLYSAIPIYTYSLRQALTTVSSRRIASTASLRNGIAAGWRPSQEDLTAYGRRIPDELYGRRI